MHVFFEGMTWHVSFLACRACRFREGSHTAKYISAEPVYGDIRWNE